MENKDAVKKVLDYIEDHLEGRLNLDEIAKVAGYSKFHLNRVFSDHVGCTIYKYIQMRRLTAAGEKLVNTAKSILEIAYEANYNSQQSFTLAFHQFYGCPPQQYRTMGIHTAKCQRFTIENRFMMMYQSYRKGEVMAA